MTDPEAPAVDARVLVLVDGDRDPAPGTVWWRGTLDDGRGPIRLLAFALDDGRRVGADQCAWVREVRA